MPETNTAAELPTRQYQRDNSTLEPEAHAALEKAINHFGGQQGLCDALMAAGYGRITVGAFREWFMRGVPPIRGVQMEKVTKGAVRRFEFNRELY